MSVDAIEEAVEQLTLDELAQFRAWFEQFDADQWDAKIADDAKSGKLDHLADEALADFKAGRTRTL